MYLVVFVYLMLSIIGLYTEVYALQVSKMLARQTAIGQTMMAWHGGATAFARLNKENLGTGSTSMSGCLLTSGITLTNPVGCGVTPGAMLLASSDTIYLPSGYQDTYRWYSIAYAPSGAGTQQYVLTFASPSTGGISTSVTAHPSIGYSPAEILQQLKNSGAPRTAYGMTKTIGFGPSVHIGFVTLDSPTYPIYVPTAGYGLDYVPAGSVGIISPF